MTESELIALMEKHGIGTDASMAVHINNISERDYVKIVGSRRLMPTNLGLSLIKGYNDIDKDLAAPDLRSGIEKSVSLIAKVIKNFNILVICNAFRVKKNSMKWYLTLLISSEKSLKTFWIA